MYSLNCISQRTIFSSSFFKQIFTGYRILVDVFFFLSALKAVTPLSSILHDLFQKVFCNFYLCSRMYYVRFFCWLPSIFLFVFNSSSKLNIIYLDVCGFGGGGRVSCVVFSELLCDFLYFWNILSHYFFKIFFPILCLFYFWDSNDTCVRSFDIFLTRLRCSVCSSPPFCFLFLHSG